MKKSLCREKKAYTLIEALAAAAIFSLVALTAYNALSYGAKNAAKGVARSKIMIDGQNILTQIKTDLALAAFPFEINTSKSASSVLSVSYSESESEGCQSIKIYTLNGLSYEQKAMPGTQSGYAFRRLNLVEYRLVSKNKSPLKRLERRVISSSGTGAYKLLSDGVNSFFVEPITVCSCGISRAFYRVSLQLFDSESKQSSSVPIIANFTDTVSPNVINSFLSSPFLNRSWYADYTY